jgi:hypothetical protein
MKRYKLIKKYPGCPNIGTIVYSPHKIYYVDRNDNDKYKIKNERNVQNWIFYSKDYIEKYPKFWKQL